MRRATGVPTAAARDAHGRRDVGLGPAGSGPLDDQQPATDGETSVRVGHEDLLGREDVRHLHSARELSLSSVRCGTNHLAGYT